MTSGSLTSLLYLMVFLSLIDQAKEECFDYFDSPTWENHAPDMVRLQTEKNSTDVVECTLEHLCVNHHSDKPCHILRDCFGRKSATMNIKSESGNCVAHLSDDPIHILHFICIAAKKLKVPDKVKGCEHEAVCPFFMAAPTLGSSRAALTTLQTPTATPTAAATEGGESGNVEKKIQMCKDRNIQDSKEILKVLLAITSSLAVGLPLAVYVCMRWQRRRDISRQPDTSTEGALAPRDEDTIETTHLMQPTGILCTNK